MRKQLAALLIGLVFLVAACGTGPQANPSPSGSSPVGSTAAPLGETGQTSERAVAYDLPPAGEDGMLRAAILQPETRESLMQVSNLLTGFEVRDASGAIIGTISDYIVNTCETYIIYVVVDQTNPTAPNAAAQGSSPSDSANAAAGTLAAQSGSVGRFLIPFEAFSANGGAWDAQNKVLVLNVSAAQALQTPAFATPALFPLTWEEPVRAFWKDQVRLSGLSSACSTPSGLTHKIAYASQLLQAELRDGNGELLGQVTDAVLEPESGSIDFFVVQLANRQATVLVPLGAVNIPEEALQGGQPVWLVLLTDTARLEGAPTIDSIAAGLKIDAANTARGYWNR